MRLKYIDVLKAIAIIAVVLYHSGFLTYGYLGVDLFLVINGYFITKGLTKKFQISQTEGGNLLVNGARLRGKDYFEFEISRVARLLPVLLVAGFACMLAGFFVMLPDDYENLSESVVATNVFANNILSAITTKNYWNVVNEYKPLMHTWYVGVVMQFYLIYPLLFYIAKLDKKTPKQTLLSMVSVLAVMSLLVYFGTADVAQRFYYLPSRFFEFAAGGIVALTWNPQENKKVFQGWFVYLCYALLLALIIMNIDMIPANVKLVGIVGLSVVLIMSSDTMENQVTANGVLAKIGAASYSIFVWHQVLLAYYRYSYSSHFTVLSYILFLAVVALLSWLTYTFIEQQTSEWLKGRTSKFVFYVVTIGLWIGLTGFAGYIFKRGGVVRDVPELYISINEKADHKAYNDKIYQLDKPFESDKKHWLVIGNSFGRDFANVILESPIADSVEISYIHIDNDFRKPEYASRFKNADRVWLSTLGVNENVVNELEVVCSANRMNPEKIVIVGEKNFGECNGQFYINRNKSNYFEQRTKVGEQFIEKNNRLKDLYGDRYLDLISLVTSDALI